MCQLPCPPENRGGEDCLVLPSCHTQGGTLGLRTLQRAQSSQSEIFQNTDGKVVRKCRGCQLDNISIVTFLLAVNFILRQSP